LAFFAAFPNPQHEPDVNEVSSYVAMFKDVSEMVTGNLLKFYATKEMKDRYFEEMELLIHLCEEIIPKIESYKFANYFNDQPKVESYKFVNYFNGQILTLKFLHQNLSYDFERNTINYDSYFSALKNIQMYLGIPNIMKNPPQNLVNSCTQFIIYSYIISKQNCTKLFEYQGKEHLTHLAIFYIKREIRSNSDYHKSFCKYPAVTIENLFNLFNGDVTGEIKLLVEEGCIHLNLNTTSNDQLYKLQNVEYFNFLWNSCGLSALGLFLCSSTNLELDVN
jgi:hypothetical protein